MDEKVLEKRRLLREKNFDVKVINDRCGYYENEVHLRVTHNGFQWQGINLSEQEARKVIDALSKHFNF